MSAPTVISGKSAVAQACAALSRGEVIGMPTETVYGLAADAASAEAVANIFAAKNRPSFNPLISHVPSLEAARLEGEFAPVALALAKAFWPGPLTLVVPANPSGKTCELARAGLSSIGLRVPGHPLAQALLQAFDGPLSAPSANPSGGLSPTRAQDVARELGTKVQLVIDGGPCQAGIESTIVSVLPGDTPRLLRPGAIAREQVEQVVGKLAERDGSGVNAPGQLSSHYAPNAAIRLQASSAREGELLLGFGEHAPPDTLNLSSTGDTVEAAANLYQMLRTLDGQGARTIAVMTIPNQGLGEAINDRLQRAAAPRDQH